MKKTTLAIVCLLGCTALSLSAQEAEKKQLHEIKVKFDKVPDGLANVSLGELESYISENVKQQSVVINRKVQTPTATPSTSLAAGWKELKLK
nr:hypothetical protein [Prevotella sp.]